MKTYVALLRGINVGGHNKVSMAELRELLSKVGLNKVQTYIQSGNVIFESFENESYLENKIKDSIKECFGYDISILVKSKEQLNEIFNSCPFENDIKEKSYFIVLNKIPKPHLIKEAEKISFEEEELIIKNDCLYFYSALGYGQTKFNMNTFERKLQVKGTARNYNTMLKLLSLCDEI